jgi:hypothetical protein
MKSLTFQLIKYFFALISCLILVNPINTLALPETFDTGLTMSDQDLYSLPLAYSSKERIQAYLESTGSILATTNATIGFEDAGGGNTANTDDLLLDSVFNVVPEKFRPRLNVQNQFAGTQMRVSELIWRLTRERFGNSCIINYYVSPYRASTDICVDTEAKPINPGLLIMLIQKESGLITGACSKSDAQNASSCQSLGFRLDRIVGYACFENPDRTRSCYDENPNWKFSKGIFRQLYKGVRSLRLREESCKIGGSNAFRSGNNVFQVGNTVTISNLQVVLKNGITCAFYIYTPHISAQQLTYNLLKQFQIDRNLVQKIGIDPNYIPRSMRPIPVD